MSRAASVLLSAAALLVASSATADTFDDDFSAGIRSQWWSVDDEGGLYLVDDTQGDVRMSKPVGGTHSLQACELRFLGQVAGDFDVTIAFRDASIDRIDGSPGNQVQLNASFGGQFFAVVRSDELGAGHNRHVWVDPPGEWRAAASSAATSGTMRIVRVGAVVSGYYNEELVHSQSFSTGDVTLSVSLQNNGTIDATAVTFDDFSLVATSVVDVPHMAMTGFDLRPVRPNPARGSCALDFSLARPGEIALSIFSIDGRVVRPVASGRFGAGLHHRSWDLRDTGGRRVPPGVYLAVLSAEGQRNTRRIVVLE